MRIDNKDKLRNLVIILRVATIFIIIANKSVKRKLKVSKLSKILISLNVDVVLTKSIIIQLNKKSCSKNFLLSYLFLRSQSSASKIIKVSTKITLL